MFQYQYKKWSIFLAALLISTSILAQPAKVQLLPYGNMNQWIQRKVKESYIIGGATKNLYEIAPSSTKVPTNTAYKNTKSPWATSSVYAKVHGITKGSVTVFPEKRKDGYAARLETRVERVKVLGVVNINVLASGTIFLGQMVEPITNTDNPKSKLISGIPFTKEPTYLQFDYKVNTGGVSKKVDGLTSGSATGTTDHAEVFVILQKRWEDQQGNVYAKRIGTGWEKLTESKPVWQNKHRIKIHYGNITHQSFYKHYMGLINGDEVYYTKNSKGKMVPIHEVGWGTKAEGVTHVILQFSSSDGGPYIGHEGNKLWVDNVAFVY